MTTLDDLPEDDLLKQEPPPAENFLERIKFVARCLAYGAVKDFWSARIGMERGRDVEEWGSLEDKQYNQNLRTYLYLQWNYQQPRASFLETFGYLKRIGSERSRVDYLITREAFELLEQPLGSKVFISYRRMTSSAFALLLSDRLKAQNFDVFVDLHNIEPADAWWEKIEEEILLSNVFVSLIAPGTLESPPVRKELKFALDNGVLAIPIWHNGFSHNMGLYPDFDEFLSEINAIVVEIENVLQYQNAIAQLIQFLQTGTPK